MYILAIPAHKRIKLLYRRCS